MRKRDQEIESLVFRNEQLTKRIMVLQQDLQSNASTKKNKNKQTEISSYNEVVDVVNEELQKKIVENAQLFNTVSRNLLSLIFFKHTVYLYLLCCRLLKKIWKFSILKKE